MADDMAALEQDDRLRPREADAELEGRRTPRECVARGACRLPIDDRLDEAGYAREHGQGQQTASHVLHPFPRINARQEVGFASCGRAWDGVRGPRGGSGTIARAFR